MHGLSILLFVENFPSLRVNCWRHLSICPEQLGWAKAVLLPVLSCRSAHRIWRWVGCLVQHHPPRSHQVHPCQEKEPLGTCSYWTCKQRWGTEGEKGKILFFCSVEFFGVVFFCFNHLQRSGTVISTFSHTGRVFNISVSTFLLEVSGHPQPFPTGTFLSLQNTYNDML